MQAGLLATYQSPIRNRQWPAWVLSAALVASYLTLYFTDDLEAPARALGVGSKWTLYGLVYSLAMVAARQDTVMRRLAAVTGVPLP